jgi:hypothetical protein
MLKETLQREDVYKHFRFTRRTTLISLTGFVFVPGAIYYLASQTHVSALVYQALICLTSLHTIQLKYKWTGRRKDEALTQS